MADSLYSVFQKFCPQCTASVSRDADYCDCGYSFNGDSADNSDPSLAQAIAEEKLYEDYLQARVTQTAQAAIAAQTAHQKKPEDGVLALAARNAMEEAEQCRAELAAQTEKVAEMERALEAERHRPHGATPVPAATPAAAQSARLEPAVVTITPVAAVDLPLEDVPTTTVTVTATVTAPPAPKPSPVPTIAPVVAKAPVKAAEPKPKTVAVPSPAAAAAVAPAVVAAPPSPAPSAAHVHQPARVLKPNLTERVTSAAEALRAELAQMRNGREATPRKEATDVKVPAPVARAEVPPMPVVAKPVVAQPAAPMKPVQEILAHASSVKKEKREAAQAAKAQKIREARLARQAQRPVSPPQQVVTAESPVVAAVETPPMQEIPFAAPVHKPAVAVAAPVVQTKECANCTAAVALSARRCKCGYEFPDSAQVTMPALALDPGEAATVVDLYSRRR